MRVKVKGWRRVREEGEGEVEVDWGERERVQVKGSK